MKEAGIGYGAINHPIDRDPVCGYTGIIGEVCPRCGRREGEGVPLSSCRSWDCIKITTAPRSAITATLPKKPTVSRIH